MQTRMARPISPRDLVQILFRHKGKVLLWTGFVAVLCVGAILFLPRKYESEAKLFLKLGRESVTLDPSATTGTTIQVQESRENQINSTGDMLKSRALLERVVEKVGPKLILEGPAGAAAPAGPPATGFVAVVSGVVNHFPSIRVFPPVSPTEAAVSKLSDSIYTTVARNSSVINVGCTAKTPRLAQQIMQAFLDAYQEQHRAANHTSGSLEFFNTQTAQLKQQLDVAIGKLRDAKNQSGIIAMSVEQQALQTQRTQIEAAALAADSTLSATEASLARLRESLKELPEQITTQQITGPNTAADGMRQELFKLQISLRELEVKLGEAHPLVQTKREQAQQSEAILNTQAPERTQRTTGINTSRQTLDLDLRRAEASAASLRAKTGTLNAQYAALQQRMRALNEHEVRISELSRQKAIAEVSYRTYVEHLEQARIGEALEASRISNVNVVQPPSLVEQPISPKPLSIIGLGFFTVAFGSLGLAFGSEYLDNSLKNAAEIESHLNLPVLVSIPRTRSNHVLMHR